jgi:hypothetical protein
MIIWNMTYRDRRESEGNELGTPVILSLLTSSNAVTDVKDLNRSSGRFDNPVASMCRFVSFVNAVKVVGKFPPGRVLSPMTDRVCSAVRAPSSVGNDCGIAGAVSFL